MIKKNAPLDNVVAKLPSYQEILEHLIAVDDSPYYSEHLYPQIAKFGGKDVTPAVLVEIINKAIHEFSDNRPMGKALEVLLVQKVQEFASVLVDDIFFQAALAKLFPADQAGHSEEQS